MQKPKETWNLFLIYNLFLAFVAILLIGGMILSPSEPGSSVFLGLSLPRLLLASGLFIVLPFSAFVFIKALKDRAWTEQTFERWFGKNRLGKSIAWLAGICFGLGWIGCFLPFYRVGLLGVHWDRIRPMMAFLLLAGLATLVMVFLKRSTSSLQTLEISKTYKLSLFLFLPAILLLSIMLYTDLGVYASEDYWYGAGVPILVTQLITAIVSGILFLQAEKSWNIKRFDLIFLILLYMITAILWAREPLQKSFLFIGPYAPNRDLYPFADGALYDTASQFALIGQNFLFYNGLFFERALYASFLVLLHSLFGQDYGQLMAAQAVVFAIFPALVYLIGRSLNMRAIGVAAALVALFRGANSIAASNMIDMANPKMMLTDFPTAIAVALLILLACHWLRRPRQNWHYALWVGGIIGLAMMLRTNALVLLLFVPLFAFLFFPFQWKVWAASSFLILLAVFAVTLPWELRNQSLGGEMYSSILTKLQNVIDLRYRKPMPPKSSVLPETLVSSVSLRQTQILLELYKDTEGIQQPSCTTTVCFVPNHFLHNILTSILVLPTSPVLDDLRHTVKESHTYWQPDWDGSFTGPSLLLFGLNLFLIVLGITIAWNRHRLIGLVPLAIFVVYNLSNGFARTSGGRYIVPVDWILTIYFLIGVFQTIILFTNVLGTRWMLFPSTQNKIVLRKVS
jgi:hypothetical protein